MTSLPASPLSKSDAVAAIDLVVAAQAEDGVVAAERIDRVVPARAGQHFVVLGAGDRGALVAAFDRDRDGGGRLAAIFVLDRVSEDDDRGLAGGEIVEVGARIELDLVGEKLTVPCPAAPRRR